MNFTFSDEQEMLRDSAREFLQSKYPVERVAEIADGEGFDPSSWSEVAELGWTGISLPEDAGGAGMSFLEEMVVIEELGRAVYPGPFFSTVVLALPALSLAPELLESVVAGKSAATLAWAGDDGRFAADAAVDVCEKAIQAHGGIGFTWEHPLHRFYKRALWISAFMGWPSAQRARIAAELIG